MLDVFHHAGFPVTSNIEYGTVILRFPIVGNDTYRTALADRETSRRTDDDAPATTGRRGKA